MEEAVKVEALKEEIKAEEPTVEEAKVEATSTTTLENDAGETYFELSHKKRATIRKYKNSILVDVREVCFKSPTSIHAQKSC